MRRNDRGKNEKKSNKKKKTQKKNKTGETAQGSLHGSRVEVVSYGILTDLVHSPRSDSSSHDELKCTSWP